jgi:hypothetical protein
MTVAEAREKGRVAKKHLDFESARKYYDFVIENYPNTTGSELMQNDLNNLIRTRGDLNA